MLDERTFELTDALSSSLETPEFRRGPGGRPTREEAERRHRALLDAATALFLERGLNGASIDAIAERAGVAKRFIYARYADKAELFVAAIGRFVEERLSPFKVPEVVEFRESFPRTSVGKIQKHLF